MHLLARLRLELARRPWIYWVAIALLGAVVTVGVSRAMARVDAARRAWGEPATVWKAATDIEPGQPIVATRSVVPRAVVPSRAVTDDPTDAVARQHLAEGEIVIAFDVTAAGPAGLVPDGSVAIAVPTTGEFGLGDRVDVFAAERSLGDGLVVARTDADVMVAVPMAAAGDLAAAVLAGTAVIALAP